MIATVAKTALRLLQGAVSVLGVRSGTEEPRYFVEGRIGGVQIRRYGSRIAAETVVFAEDEGAARNIGFDRLAGYIFGGNHSRTEISMTAPVTQQPADRSDGQTIAMTAPVSQSAGPDGAWVIRFFMPARWTMETLPEPDDTTVELVTVPAETVAALRFRGSIRPSAIAAHVDQLVHVLQNTAYQPAGTPVAWFYDPPWTVPVLRRNEVAVAVTPPS